ncbi:MAG: hypothetical protein KGJ89_01245 [Patescibacteria group bacterium]|nr:hypothetical protein [Patescibacteria group bacterium]MDE2015137.1 hypothetical protein [Patescibacteria group bacterium]MDE2226565.1 hypothetical protein [Patescibacteria group bacterium]
MSFRYSSLTRAGKIFYRRFFPVPKSPYTIGEVKDICAVNLVPPETLINFFKNCLKKLKEIKGEEVGDYFEFGVFNGSSIGSMYLARNELGLGSMRLFGFDAFQGLPPGSEKEDAGVYKTGFYTCSFEKMQQCLSRRNVNPDDITWIKGWYNETLTDDTIKKFSLKKIGVVFIDCDTYSSSKSVLDFLKPLITGPVIICFDDWKLYDLDVKGEGEYRSFNEFLENNSQFKAEEIKSYNRKSKSFLVTSIKV